MKDYLKRAEFYKENNTVVKNYLKIDLNGEPFDKFCTILTMASGPIRGTAIEKWFVDNNYYTKKVSSKEGRGDLTNSEVYDELKARFISDKEIKKGKAHSAGQIRLWENIDSYLFITVNKDTYEYFLFYIPKLDYKKLVLDRTVRFSSSHIKGNSQVLRDNPEMVNELEISSELNYNDYDWDKYRVSLKELHTKLNVKS
jgi:hypothetical protein